MYAYIEGTLASCNVTSAVIDVRGIGYELYISINTFESLPQPGSRVKLLTHLLVREDVQLLYGFISEEERELFRLVTKVRGFGAKTAIAVLSNLNPQEFIRMIQTEDKSALIRLPGIGSRSADRLLLELRDKINLPAVVSEDKTSVPGIISDVESALIGLGYKPAEIRKVLGQINTSEDIRNIIRQALQLLGKS